MNVLSVARGAHLHIDCASGVAGDMMLGALIDLGVPVAAIGDALDAIGAGRDRLRVNRVVKAGIAAVDVTVDTSGSIHDHAHGHYPYADIRARIVAAPLTAGTRRRALDIFDRLARAEAKLHGMAIGAVEFHEVGAIDSVVDVVGTAAALDWLAPTGMTCTSVAMGSGTLRCAHGVLPVPAPAALEIMREAGGVMADGGLPRELCTPTGAAILAASVTAWTPAPLARALAVGWGAGDANLADRANVVRVTALAPEPAPSHDRENDVWDIARETRGGVNAEASPRQRGRAGPLSIIWQIDANIDDMSAELCGPAADAIFAAGALDVWWTPITMKKGRPALLLSVLADTVTRDAAIAAILRETTTIGVRFAPRQRTVLARRIVEVQTRYGAIAVKLACDGDIVRNAAPEYEACAAAARTHDVAVKLVFAAALAAYDATR